MLHCPGEIDGHPLERKIKIKRMISQRSAYFPQSLSSWYEGFLARASCLGPERAFWLKNHDFRSSTPHGDTCAV